MNTLCVTATHFSYGIIRWEKTPDYFYSKKIRVFFEGCYRWNFFGTNASFPLYSLQKLSGGALQYLNPSGTIVSKNGLNIASQDFNVTESFKTLNWFGGRSSYIYDTSTLDTDFTIRFSLCCRFNSLADGNKNLHSYLATRVNLQQGFSGSPVARAVPRIYLVPKYAQILPLKIFGYTIAKLPAKYRVSSKASSSLSAVVPCGNSKGCTGVNLFSLNNDGVMSWTPFAAGAYAFQAQYVEVLNTQENYTSIDLLFDVQNYTCTNFHACKKGTNNVPFITANNEYKFKPGIATTYEISVTDLDSDPNVSTTAIYLPDGADLTHTSTVGVKHNYILRWNPNVDQTISISCIISYDSAFVVALGNNCFYMNVEILEYIFINGIVRDFEDTHIDFKLTTSSTKEQRGTTLENWVLDDLVDNKPVFKSTVTGTGAPKKFAEWFNDVANVNASIINTITLSDKKELSNRSLPVFSLRTDNFFPIDGKLFAASRVGRNYLFTYELHTYFTYTGDAVETYSFKSNCDMWVFVENKLAKSPTLPQNLHGHGTTSSSIAATSFVLDMGKIASTYSPALVPESSYKIDIFFAQRMDKVDPIFEIEMSKSTHCNALNMIRDDVSASATAIDLSLNTDTDIVLNGVAEVTGTGAQILGASNYQSHESGSIWFGELTTKTGKQKVMSGFRTKFSFQTDKDYAKENGRRTIKVSNKNYDVDVQQGPDGFAFVIQNHDIQSRGPGGSNLGYASLRNSVAIEFDFLSNARNDPKYQHISVHTAYGNANSAEEDPAYYPSGSTYTKNDPLLPFYMNNGSRHDVRIDFSPSEDVTWMTIYLNENIRPVFEAQLDTSVLRTMWRDGAYVGFTAGNGGHTTHTALNTLDVTIPGGILLRSWNMMVVPPLAETSTYETGKPTNVVAGSRVLLPIQLRDYCGNPIFLTGVSQRLRGHFTSLETDTRITVDAVDILDGKYTFEAVLTAAGLYEFHAEYQTVTDGPFEAIDKGTILAFSVLPAQLSLQYSQVYHGILPEGINTMGSESGYFCLGIQEDGKPYTKQGQGQDDVIDFRLIASHLIQNPTTVDVFIPYFDSIAINDYIACVKKGSVGQLSPGDVSRMKDRLFMSSTPINNTNAIISIVQKTAANMTVKLAFMENKSRIVYFKHTVIPPVGSIVENFTIYASSAIDIPNVPVKSYLQIAQRPHRTYINAENSVTIAAFDIYKNAKHDVAGEDFLLIVNPRTNVEIAECASYQGHLSRCGWMSPQTGVYTGSVSTTDGPVDQDISINILSGPASHIYSSSMSIPQTIIAGQSSVLTIRLRDIDNMAIDVQNPDDVVTVILQTTDVNISPPNQYLFEYVFEANSAIRTYNLPASLAPTKAGIYDLIITINGEELVATENVVVHVVPSDVDPSKSIVYGDVYDDINTPVPHTAMVGIHEKIYIQTYDKYNNPRTSQETSGNVKIQLVTQNDAIILYENNGRYSIDFFVTNTDDITIVMEYQSLLISPAQRIPVRTISGVNSDGTFTLTDVKAGPLDVASKFLETTQLPTATNGKYSKVAGVESVFLVKMYDVYQNLRVKEDDIVENVVVSYNSVTYQNKLAFGTYSWDKCVGGMCELRLKATTTSGLLPNKNYYKLTVQIKRTGEHLIVVPIPDTNVGGDSTSILIDVTPDVYTASKTIFGKVIDIIREETIASFPVTLHDKYGNRISTCPPVPVVATMEYLGLASTKPSIPSIECSSCLPTDPGVYYCRFEVPVSITPSEANPLADSFKITVLTDSVNNGDMVFRSAAADDVFYAVVDITNPQPRLGNNLQFTIRNTMSTRQGDRPTQIPIIAKLVLLSSNTANPADEPNASFSIVTGKVSPTNSALFTFDYTFTTTGDFILIPMRSGGLESDYETLGSVPQRRGVFHPGLFYPPSSPITTSTSSSTTTNTIVAGNEVVWTVVPHDILGNRFRICQAEIKLQLFVFDLDSNNSTLEPVSNASCQCKIDTSITPPSPLVECKFSIEKATRYDIYILNDPQLPAPTNPADIPEDIIVSASSLFFTVLNNIPSQVHSILADDSTGKGFLSYDFETPATSRVLKLNTPFSVFILLFDQYKNPCKTGDFTTSIGIKRDNVNILGSNPSEVAVLRNGNQHVYRAMFTFTKFAPQTSTQVVFSVNSEVIPTKYDIIGGFRALIPSGPAASVLLTSASNTYTVDEDIQFTLTLSDALNQRWVQNVLNPSLDSRSIIFNLYRDNSSSSSSSIPIQGIITKLNDVGVFTINIAASQLRFADKYTVEVIVDGKNLSSVVPSSYSSINIIAGKPNLSSMQVVQNSKILVTGSAERSNTFSFTLFDTKGNPILSQVPEVFKFVPIMGTLSCASPDLTWSVVNPASSADLRLESTYDSSRKTIVYTVYISPRRVSFFTVVIFGADKNNFAPFIPFADIPENYAVDCLVSSTLTYEIIPGPASAANSIVQITAPNPIPGSAFPDYTLISGTEVTMTVQLKDTSDQNTITNNYCVQMGHIGGPTGNSADATVLEHYPCAPNCNTLPLRDSIIISPRFDFKQRLQGLFEFKFTLTGVRFDKNFNEPLPYDVVFYLLEYPSDPFSTNTNINNVPLICPEGLQRSTQISGQQSHRMKLKILPSAPKTLRPGKIIQQSLYDDDEDSLPTTFIAGQDLLLVLISADGYGNHVIISTDPDSKSYSTAVEIKRLSSVAIFDQYTDEKPPVTPIYMPMYIFFADMSTNDDGSFIAKFQPAWEGNYLLTSMLFSSDNNIVDFVLTIPFTVQHIKCELRGYQFLTCPDGSCVDDLSKCAVSPVCTEEGKLIQCFDKTCVSTPSECPCPIDTERCETTSQCVSTISSNTETCPAASTCSNVTCPNDQTQCREDEQSCPSIGVCPLAYILCPNGYSCASEVAKCPPLRQPSDCPADSQYVCYDGSCANDISNCPTKITCPLDTVLCLTDNTCRESIQDCPMYYEECSGNMIRCITGSCASSYDACPSSISCPIGYTKCENGACASSITQCHKTIQCNISEVRCYDGSCAQNPILCPSQIVCPIDLPVMCSDHNCVSSISECNDISTTTCPQGSQVCPDGTCILGTRCPVVKRCPVERPILCSNNTCVSDRVDCNPPLECTSSLPIRCSNGDCRANILDCPSIISCPISRPLRCNDGSCAQALNTCTEIIAGIDTGLPSDNKDKEKDKDRFICPYPKITCPGGECADTRLLCPTHVTCPLGSVKCNDGRCAAETDCPSSNDGNYCPDDKLLCPISTAGISCASKINDCPTNIICPENKPVRCIDSTCAVSITACPPLADAGEEGSSSETKKPCSDGSWTVGTCSTTVTCTAEIPYKCYDQSCRKSPFDCPIPPICPSATPYLCSTGSCAKFLWDCTVPVDGICEEANKPIKCPIVDGNMKCVDDTIHCDKRLDDDTTGNRTYCPGNNVYCRDGTCKESAAACPLPTCPPSLPYLCQDGMCAKNNLQCNHENGCPFNKPVKCADGECKFRFAECSHFACPSTQDKISSPSCADGTCRDECSDIGANGCRVGYFRCYDGSCVSSYTQCISSTDSMNVCPGNRPVRCESGLCVTTKSNCPILDPSHTICPNPLKPIFCADGSCQENSILCRTIKPCDRENTVRCDDGVCRDVGRFDDKEQCPKLQSCPPQLPFRCPSGPCSTNSQTCPDVDGCPMINSVAQFRCPSGLCVQDLDLCKTVSSSNGCPSDAVKCWDGSCQDSSNKCPKNNGCSSATPYRCTSGKCVDSLDNCTADDKLGCSAPNVKCADGSCEASISMCKTTLGCPVTKPIRCADGNCAKYPATFREPIFGLPSDQLELTCTPTIICPSANHVRCANGECAASYDLCPSFNNICTTIEKPYLCSDNKTCVEDLQKCVSSTCPPTSPVLCPNGGCSLTALDCNNRYNPQTSTIAGSSVVSRCGSKKITCFDGSCADRYQECVNHASDIENDAIIQNPLDYIRCGTICSDGSCLPVNSASLCPPIPSCPANHYRCESGACVEDTNACDTLSPCKSYQIRGVDGICRTIGTNPPFDGCDWDTAHRYMCENRECAENAAGCEAASRLDADVWANTLFKDSKNMKKAIDDAKAAAAANDSNNTSNNISQVPSSTVTPPSAFESVTSMTEKIQLLNDDGTSFACQEDCYNQIKVNRTSVNYSASEAVTIPLAPISTRLQVTIPTGLYVDSKGGSAFYFSSVSESIVVNATNRVHYSRVNGAENYPSTLTYAQTVLSPIVSCYTEKGIEQPFAVPVELSSNIDMHHNLKYNDVCLARLRRFNNLESPYTTWECVYSTAERLQEKYSVKKDPTILPGYVTSSIYYCNDPDVLSEPAIYAFILNPLTSRQVYKQSLDTFFRDNMIWILLGACGGLLVIAMILFTFQRLARFKGKTVQIKDDVKRMENEVDEMEQFGGKAGTKDEEVMLQHNPLAVQLADVQKLTDDNQLKLQQEKIAQQQAESNERTNIIVQLEEETKRGLEMLDNMKKKLHDTTQAKRVNGDDMTVQISSTESATSRGPTANTNDTSQSQVSSPKALDTQPQQTMKKRHDM